MATQLWEMDACELARLVPVGVAGGLPQGVQIIGPRFREDLCLAAAEAVEEPLTPIDPSGH